MIILTTKIPRGGTLMTMGKFVEDCLNNRLIDYDGFGYYASESEMTDIIVFPSIVKQAMLSKNFTHVYWFNR